MSDIVLASINAKWIHPSLALRLIKANLGGLQDCCEILEFALRQPLHEKTGPLLAARPRILGLSVSIWNHRATLELLKDLCEKWRCACEGAEKPVVVLGGPEVSYLPREAEIFRYADYVIRGEGETAFRELCEKLLGEKGETETGGPQRSGVRFIDAPQADLSVLKPAYYLYSDEDLRRKLVYVEASRGCPFGCEFCLSAAGDNSSGGDGGPREVREFPLEPFLAEMGGLVRRGGRTFKFLDRTFNLNIPRALAIMEFFLKQIEAAPSLCVHFEMIPGNFPRELRDCLRRFPAGSLRLELGIQTFNPKTAALIHRAGDPGSELEILDFLGNETKAIVHADLIAALPGEGLASFGEGFDRLRAAGPAEIQLGILKLLPGAPIARHTAAWGMRYSAEPPYEALETAALPAADLDRLKNFARFWELIMNRSPFPELSARLFPPGAPAFKPFMELSDRLLERFGRNWGIDRERLKEGVEEYLGENQLPD
ncbi:MAG: cobalamin-dependent protein, partial [Treponema sp.]|jgi:hypothetical protein|nr:cobalamin-dependent protein [Treponema sp.]